MKKTRIALLSLSIAAAGMFSFNNLQKASIKGKVTPAEGAKQAWALSAKDTLKTTITDGSFQFNSAEEGVYRIIIEANAPYKNTAKDSVVVTGTQPTDVGEITLRQ
jgi:hypothetical protein